MNHIQIRIRYNQLKHLKKLSFNQTILLLLFKKTLIYVTISGS